MSDIILDNRDIDILKIGHIIYPECLLKALKYMKTSNDKYNLLSFVKYPDKKYFLTYEIIVDKKYLVCNIIKSTKIYDAYVLSLNIMVLFGMFEYLLDKTWYKCFTHKNKLDIVCTRLEDNKVVLLSEIKQNLRREIYG